MKAKLAYLPCELKARDLDSQMLIAAHLLKRGIGVIIGQQWSLWLSLIEGKPPQGCVLFGTANKIQASNMRAAKLRGHIVIGMDQESLPFSGNAFLDNVDPVATESAEVFLVATEAHQQALRTKYPKLKVRVVGSPRVDIMRASVPPRPIDEPYVLFNTSFALTNSVLGSVDDAMKILVAGGGIETKVADERLNFEIESKAELMKLIHWSAANLPWLTVVRPHPAENPETWQKFSSNKIRIVSGQGPIPWIANAELIIHANSTTGFESAVMGRPCINVAPRGYDSFLDQYVLKRINVTVGSADETVALIREWMRGVKSLQSSSAAVDYPSDSAFAIAELMAGFVEPFVELPKMLWLDYKRPDKLKAKFTASADEMNNALMNAGRQIGLKPTVGFSLTDSVMAFAPNK